MLLFTTKGFFSIVQHKDDPACFMVKARVKGDIEKHWPKATVIRTDDADYLYRATIRKSDFMPVITAIILGIDYPSYKGAIEDKKRYWNYYDPIVCVTQNMQVDYDESNSDRPVQRNRNRG